MKGNDILILGYILLTVAVGYIYYNTSVPVSYVCEDVQWFGYATRWDIMMENYNLKGPYAFTWEDGDLNIFFHPDKVSDSCVKYIE